MPELSGKNGQVNIDGTNLLAVRNWKLQTKANIHQYSNSSTAGFKRTLAGIKSGSGSFATHYRTDSPITDFLEEGDLVAADLHLDSGGNIDVDIRIESIDWGEVDIEEGAPIPIQVSFVTDGAWDYTNIDTDGSSQS